MARDPRVPTETEIPWWGYLVVALAIVLVIIVAVVVWRLIAVLNVTPGFIGYGLIESCSSLPPGRPVPV